MGRLTTHVLDTAAGRPAAGLRIDLYGHDDDSRRLITTVVTNDDGRVDAPLVEGADFDGGRYQLVFHAGAYLRASGTDLPEVPFLDEIVIAFGIDRPDQHYHVPLLLSPYGYSTYRGS
ncbi:MAG: hydroxyisourate hydrolase [Candidatus Puniceispirillaceae bacterium]|jgi:5-hydroxyisourate hydrolase